MRSNVIALIAGLAATATAFDCSGPYFSFYNRPGQAVSYQRLDPALFPSVESPHLHSFDGGNALSSSMGFEDTQSSTCTTARIKPDNSLYWRPTLYWNGNNTGFYRVPDKFLKIYYKFGDGNARANVTEFPEDFKMIAGNPFKRSDDGENPGGIKWSCKGENYQSIDAVGFPKGFTSCKEGLATEITFPSCWNGKPIDPKKPGAHMAYPTAGGEGINACPDGFKTSRFPTIFVEFWYDVSAFDGQYSSDDVPWVLSNGDPTGYGWHADFLNGWEKGVLAKATAETGYCNCGCGCGNEEMKVCFGAENVNDDGDEEFKSCAAKDTYGGDDKSPLEKLPGCNPLQSGPADATQATGEGCVATPAPSSKDSSSTPKTTAAPESTSVEAEDHSSSVPTHSFNLPNKNNGNQDVGNELPTETSDAAPTQYPTSAESNDELPSLTLVHTAKPAETTAPAEITAPAGGDQCKAPVYVTITPTIYVTADSVANSTCDNTVYETTTQTATVTVGAESYKHRRHADVHKH